ncbi:type II toxin-antitoxin system RelE/ParE family toxin [Caenispirillum bisanense]|uniref:ParE toxin of type II toxin-antitoxin system, parDE n=1 Tax=Caenispirillum bisanense TaxID=414052 RepID=A0A286GRZ9_9PROT|nr:type II toxin-antitoxin system RelE/ParE family toxin [Caenispirillum bisanense]SOD97714.1 ParE toxin of type II toxin-antitoxin system, parDE [Caenispirillum bisanense]
MTQVVWSAAARADVVRILRFNVAAKGAERALHLQLRLIEYVSQLEPRRAVSFAKHLKYRSPDGYIAICRANGDELLLIGLFHEREDWTALLARRLAKPDPA